VAIPDFQTLMRPLLELHADGGEKTQPELRDALAHQFALTEDDLAERLPSGTARTFVNRVAWASTHMKEAGLLVKPRRGISAITERGRTVLGEYSERVDMSVLEQFPEYVEFRTRSSGRRRVTQPQTPEQLPLSTTTPEETIDAAYRQIRTALAEELLSRLVERGDRFFEEVVLDVLVALGYGGSRPDAAERVGRSGDGGIDGVIREDTLGLDAIYMQAKKWAPERNVGPTRDPRVPRSAAGRRGEQGDLHHDFELLVGCSGARAPPADRVDGRTRARHAYGRDWRGRDDPRVIRAQADRRGLLLRGRVADKRSHLISISFK
jgi:restriction system protein